MVYEFLFAIIATIFSAIWIGLVIFYNRKTHPKALFYLFFVELWERFSYYGMRALLVLYMTAEVLRGGFGFADGKAYGIYAAYGAMVYLTPLLGGFLADRYLGFRKAITWGAILMAAGHFAMAVNNEKVFYLALALLILGNGFFKPNISSLVGQLYPEKDPRKDGAFTIFYMGINIGAFLTPLICGAVGEKIGWHYGFGIAGIGMLAGWVIFIMAQKSNALGNIGHAPVEVKNQVVAGLPVDKFIYLFTFLLIPVIYFFLIQNDFVDIMLGILGPAAIGFLIYISFTYDKVQAQRIWVVVILTLFTVLFWSFFELAGSALTLFTERNIDRTVFLPFLGEKTIEASEFQSLNPLFIMLFAPVFSWLWIKLSRLGYEPAAPVKFALGIILLGIGFLVLQLGYGSINNYMMPAMFMVWLYLFHTLGELTLSPVGLSMITKLSPTKIVGFMMGIWFLSSSIAHQAGKHIARLTEVDEGASLGDGLELSLNVFNSLGLVSVGVGIFLLLLSPILTKWMHGIK